MSTRGYSPVRRGNPFFQLMAGPMFWAANIVWDYQPWKLPLTVLWFLPVTWWLGQRSYSWDRPRVVPSGYVAAGSLVASAGSTG